MMKYGQGYIISKALFYNTLYYYTNYLLSLQKCKGTVSNQVALCIYTCTQYRSEYTVYIIKYTQ